MTPAELFAASACYSCIPDKMAALLYLAGTTAGSLSPQQVYQGAADPPVITPDDPTKPALYFPNGGGPTYQWDVPSQTWK